MNPLEKPTPDSTGLIRYPHAIGYLEAKYQFNANDFSNHHGHHRSWCAKHGKKHSPPDIRLAQQIFAEYCAAPDGDQAAPEYQNFWHWLLDLAVPPGQGLCIPAKFRLDVPHVLATYDQEVAPLRSREQAHLARVAAPLIPMLPPEFRKAATEQYAPKSTTLPPFVRTILGYFQAEFGPRINLNLRDN